MRGLVLAGYVRYCVTDGRGVWGAPLEGCDCLGPAWRTGMRVVFPLAMQPWASFTCCFRSEFAGQ